MISEKDVKNIASLSRIHLKDKETSKLTKDLENIINYINKLDQLDVSNIGPTSHVLPLQNVFREDVVKHSFTQNKALKISIEQYKGSFKVPKVIE